MGKGEPESEMGREGHREFRTRKIVALVSLLPPSLLFWAAKVTFNVFTTREHGAYIHQLRCKTVFRQTVYLAPPISNLLIYKIKNNSECLDYEEHFH